MKAFSGLELKSVSLNTLIQFLIRISTSIPTLVATLLIAYFAGYETLGSFTKIVAFVSIFYLILDFGLNTIFIKEHYGNTGRYFGNLIILRILFSFLLIPIIIFLSQLLPENKLAGTGFTDFEKYGIAIYSLTLVVIGINMSLQAFLQRKLSYYVSLLPSLLSSAVLLILVIFASMQKNLSLLLFSYIVSGSVLVSVLFLVMKKKYKLAIGKTSNFKSFSKNIIIASLPLGMMLFFNLLYAKADIFILSIYKPNLDVGVYGISYKFFEILLAFPAYLANSVYPLLLKESKNPRTYIPLIKRYSSLFIFLSLGITFTVFFCAPLLSVIKSDFSRSVYPFQILALSLPFFFMTSLLQWHFVINNKLKFLVPLYGGALLLNIILNIIFVPVYSYKAAAISTGVSEALVFIFMLWYFVKSNKA